MPRSASMNVDRPSNRTGVGVMVLVGGETCRENHLNADTWPGKPVRRRSSLGLGDSAAATRASLAFAPAFALSCGGCRLGQRFGGRQGVSHLLFRADDPVAQLGSP